MFIDFFLELKAARVPVSLREYLTLIEAMDAGLAEYSVDDFYYLSRSCLVKGFRFRGRNTNPKLHADCDTLLVGGHLRRDDPRKPRPHRRPVSGAGVTREEKRKWARVFGQSKSRNHLCKNTRPDPGNPGTPAIQRGAPQGRAAGGLCGTSCAQTIPPIPWTARMMSYSDDMSFFGKLPDHDVVWKPLEDKPLGPSGARCTGHVREGNDLVFEKVKSRINRPGKFDAQSGALLLVPGRRFDRFFGGLFEDTYASHYRLPSRACIRRRNSSRSTSFAVPVSISLRRRRSSLSQLSATAASGGASKLLTSSCASSARSASGSISASA